MLRSNTISVQEWALVLLLCAGLGTVVGSRNTKADLARTVLSAMDTTADPCEDFYQYCCGGWVKSHTLPKGYLAFVRLREVQLKVDERLKALLGQADSRRSRPARMAANVYQACMNEGQVNRLGVFPLAVLLRTVFPHGRDFPAIMADLNLLGLRFLLNVYVSENEHDSSHYVIHIDQGSLGLSRDTLLGGRNSTELRTYERYLYALMNAVLHPHTSLSSVRQIVDFQIRTARMTSGEERQKNMTVSALQNKIPGMNWLSFLQGMFRGANVTIGRQTELMVADEDYIKSMLQMTKDARYTGTILKYLKARTARAFEGYLSEAIRNLSLPFNEMMEGEAEDIDRWETCMETAKSYMEHAVGKLYVDHYFTPASKTAVLELIQYVRNALKKMISEATWMDANSRRTSKEKLDRMVEKVGYPDYYTEDYMKEFYQDVDYEQNQYFQNHVRYLRWHTKQSFKKLNESPTKTEWGSVDSAAAFYSTTENSFELLAGILTPPFFDESFPRSMQFGAVGVVIGHELMHGFDDDGRKYDKDGHRNDWWARSTVREFKKRARCFVEQYNKEKIIDNLNVDGGLTLHENIADNGGLRAAYEGYKQWQKIKGNEDRLPGFPFSHERLFFIANSQASCSLMTPDYLQYFVPTDPHPLPSVRARVPASNLAAFSQVFNCSRDSYMARSARNEQCVLW